MSDRGLSLLAERCRALPGTLRATLDAALPALPAEVLRSPRWVITGAGASEGPARMLASLLRRCGRRCAEFVPLSSFARAWPRTEAVLVVISEGISPNAALALKCAGVFDATVVVTATARHPLVLERSHHGACVIEHPPSVEGELLLRVLGPAAATLRACQLAGEALAARGEALPWTRDDLARVAAAVEDTDARVGAWWTTEAGEALAGRLDRGCVAFVTVDGGDDLAHGLRWKWLEGTGACDPSVWDVLQVAHGPYQHLYEREFTLMALEREGDRVGSSLVDGLARMLHPTRHVLVRWRAQLPDALAFFEYDAWANALVLRAVERGERDLVAWPGKGRDGALYDVGR